MSGLSRAPWQQQWCFRSTETAEDNLQSNQTYWISWINRLVIRLFKAILLFIACSLWLGKMGVGNALQGVWCVLVRAGVCAEPQTVQWKWAAARVVTSLMPFFQVLSEQHSARADKLARSLQCTNKLMSALHYGCLQMNLGIGVSHLPSSQHFCC